MSIPISPAKLSCSTACAIVRRWRRQCRCSDVVWVSRPHNLHELLTQCLAGASPRNFRLIYDAEAIFSERAQQKRALGGPNADVVEPYDEFALAKSADTVVVVSESDRAAMLQSGVRSVHVIGHQLCPGPTSTTFAQRDTFLFVGGVHGADNPNADSIRYFCREIWPAVQKATGAALVVAGYGTDDGPGRSEQSNGTRAWSAGKFAASLRTGASVRCPNPLCRRVAVQGP